MRVVGGATLGDAACAAQTQQAEKLPLDMYIMLDSSGSMTELTSSGQTKWDAIGQALKAFLADPSSAGLGVGLQYFPLTTPGVPDSCAADSDCGANNGPCNFVRACAAAGTSCNTDADCGRGDTCELVGGCTLSDNLCLPIGGFCTGFDDECAPLDGYCNGRDICMSTPYAAPAVEVAPLPGAAAGIVASLNAHMPDGLTPTSGALTGAIAHAQALAKASNGHRVVVLLATDGLPSECVPIDTPGVAAIAAAGLAGAPSISTFVVGVFAPEEQQQSQPTLDAIAAAGGTKQSFIINLGQDVEQAFLAALTSVRCTSGALVPIQGPAAGRGADARLLLRQRAIHLGHGPEDDHRQRSRQGGLRRPPGRLVLRRRSGGGHATDHLDLRHELRAIAGRPGGARGRARRLQDRGRHSLRTRHGRASAGGRTVRRSACGLGILFLVSCAHDEPPVPVNVASLPPLPRSSIAAVVQQRATLKLTDEQVRDLEALDQEREKANAAILDEVDKRQKAAQAAAGSAGSGGAGNAASTGGMNGGGMRGGGMRGGGMGGRRGAPSASHPSAAGPDAATVQDRLDENDTKAFLDAEQVLTQLQRDPAREIASDYRAQLYERRELDRQKGSAK